MTTPDAPQSSAALVEECKQVKADLARANERVQSLTGAHELANLELERSRRLYEMTMDTATDMIFLTNSEGVVTHVNQAAKEHYAIDRETLLAASLPLAFFWCGESIEHVEDGIARVVRDEAPTKIDCVCDERIYELNLAPNLRVGRVESMICVARDITLRKRAQEALQKAHDELEARVAERTAELLKANAELTRKIDEHAQAVEALRHSQALLDKAEELTQSGSFDWDLRTNGVTVSLGGRRLIELDAERCKCDPHVLVEALHPDDRPAVEAVIRRATKGGAPFEPVEFRIFRGEEVRHLWACGEVLRNESGAPARVTGAAQDVTARKQLEHRLQESRKMEAIGRLAGGIAHDFNNMLGPILGYADLLARKLEDPKLRAFADAIARSAKHAAALTSQLVGFARQGKYLVARIDVHKTIEDVIALLKHSLDRRIDIQQDLRAARPWVMGDLSQLHNALLNLALNARDAMPNGGTLTFGTDNVECDAVISPRLPADLAPGKYLTISVSDTGVGMDVATIKHIFEPFFTTKEHRKGAGMGLASAYGTVSHHGGAITVTSEPGRGSTFTMYLPADVVAADEEPEPEGRSVEAGDARILVVDDEEDVRAAITELLSVLGYRVRSCRSGAEALEAYGRSPEAFDLVVLDLMMPGLSGRDTLMGLLELDAGVRVLLSSGYSFDEEAREILAIGAKGFVQKPYTAEQLSEQVRAALESA